MSTHRPLEPTNRNAAFGAMLFVVCAFPSIAIGGSSTDVQPWAFLFAALVLPLALLAAGDLRIPLTHWILGLVVLGFVAMYASDTFVSRPDRELNLLSGGRLMFDVLSLPLISLAVCVLRYRLTVRMFIIVYALWLLFALGQTVDPSLGSHILARVSTSATRGVTSFATEPDSYGRAEIAFSVLTFVLALEGRLSRRAATGLLALSMLQILFLSRALTSLLIFMVVAPPLLWSLYPERASRRTAIAMAAGFGGLAIWLGMRLLPTARAFVLLLALASNPAVWLAEGGFLARFFNPFLSVQVGLFHTLGRGVGLASTPVPGQTVFLWPFGFPASLPDRAHGGLVGLIYSAGILGVLFIIVFYGFLWRALRRLQRRSGRSAVVPGLIAMTMVYFFDQTVAMPLHAYLFGHILLVGGDRTEPT